LFLRKLLRRDTREALLFSEPIFCLYLYGRSLAEQTRHRLVVAMSQLQRNNWAEFKLPSSWSLSNNKGRIPRDLEVELGP
jgi:hypothetical protein